MKHGSLFSGIGGFDLAAEWMGWDNIFHCEIEDFPHKILKYYWPNAQSYRDITETDFSIYRGTIDILTGGFPCQPYSVAGKRKGKSDARHLWPEMLRAIREIKPKWIVGENVLGIVNWNEGLVFEEVCTDLEAEGYEVQPFILPACSVNAPHRRDRVWFVAYSNLSSEGETRGSNANERSKSTPLHKEGQERFRETVFYSGLCDLQGFVARSNGTGLQKEGAEQQAAGFKQYGKLGNSSGWENFPTQSPVCNGDDGFSSKLDGITFPKWRIESIKGGGNAIVPQVAFQIFKAIYEFKR